LRQLSDAGLSEQLSTQLLDIADFGVERGLCERLLQATGRDYLSGVLSRAEAETQLRRIGIQDTEYQLPRGLGYPAVRAAEAIGDCENRQSGAAGLLGAEEARARLANLQWSDPDATLLLAEAEGKLAKTTGGGTEER
jgi:hypothetical protein